MARKLTLGETLVKSKLKPVQCFALGSQHHPVLAKAVSHLEHFL